MDNCVIGIYISCCVWPYNGQRNNHLEVNLKIFMEEPEVIANRRIYSEKGYGMNVNFFQVRIM